MALGSQLREARRRMKQTASAVAAATRMKVQIVEAIEKEDFSKIAAPVYGKGFIRLYAEHVGLDPRPLIEEYMVRFIEAKTPSLVSEETSPEEVPAAAEAEVAPEPIPDEEEALDLFSRIDQEPKKKEETAGLRTGRPVGRPNVRAHALREVWHSSVRLCHRFGRQAAARLQPRVKTATVEQEPEETLPEQQPARGFPLRLVSLVVGVAVILLFVISGLSRCVGAPPPEQARELEPETLRLALDPPAPYFD